PFMYAAAAPVAITYLLIWNPPHGWSQGALFVYLIATAVLIRTFITGYEIPSTALSAELTAEYDERTKLLNYRFLFQWIGGLFMYFMAFKVFLRPDAAHKVGQLNPAGYSAYGLAAAGVMLFAILASAMGTHRQIPYLRQPPRREVTLGVLAREMFTTLAHGSFLAMLGGTLFFAMAVGLGFSIGLYFQTYFWELSADQISIFTFSSLSGAALSFVVTPLLSKGFGKKAGALTIIPIAGLCAIGPIGLRLAGLLPPNGSPVIFPMLLALGVATVCLGTAGAILMASMIADIVEDSELRTGRRSEGLFFAAAAFINKAVSGVGIFASGMLLAAIHFPQHARPGHVDPQIVRDLGLIYAPVTVALYGLALFCLTRYGITRQGHAETLRELVAKAERVAEAIES
ncbi:MAG TPA: MFS transporter, partial [Phenylobacterium sp.]|nr:MFS transporter [Phenylobacterium sp.]